MKATGLLLSSVSNTDVDALAARWREAQAAPGRSHRIAVLGADWSYTPLPGTPCSYCRTDPGNGQHCRTCGAPA